MDELHLKDIPLFASLSKAERREVARHADEVDVSPGRDLVKEGDFAYEFFVIEDGTAEVRRGGDRVAELGPGDFLGEMGIVEHAARNASVTATSPMTVAVMTHQDLHSIERAMPSVAKQIRDAVEARAQALVA